LRELELAGIEHLRTVGTRSVAGFVAPFRITR
jgi:hypothetical protein